MFPSAFIALLRHSDHCLRSCEAAGSADGLLTVVVGRETGLADFYFTRKAGQVTPGGVFWYWTGDELAKPDRGSCEKLQTRF
jgi:hypothetical protein